MSGLAMTRVMAGVTWMRLLRGRALWVSLAIAALPAGYAALMRGAERGQIGEEVFAFEIMILAILAPMFVGTSLGDEIEDRTTTYLWSRPVPRWAVVAGKLATLIPIVIAISCASWLLVSQVAWSRTAPAQTFVALAAGAIAMSLVATGITALAPKHGMALSICYVLFLDLPAGVMPAALQEASLSHQIRTLSGTSPLEGPLVEGIVGLAAISLVWALLAAWRIRRLEA